MTQNVHFSTGIDTDTEDADHCTKGVSEEHSFASIVGNNEQLAKVLRALFWLKSTDFATESDRSNIKRDPFYIARTKKKMTLRFNSKIFLL